MASTGGEEGKAGAAAGVGTDDLYAVLGLKKECSAADLRNAYKKLALRWHPDRCSAAGSLKATDDAKTKFQAIQEAYSVLSDTNKRFLYDFGAYDSNDGGDGGDGNGMGEFLGEMAAMMSQSHEGGNETFEQLQELFVEMFQFDVGAGGGTATASSRTQRGTDRASTSSNCFATTSYSFCYDDGGGGGHKRDSEEMQTGKNKAQAACDGAAGFGPGGSFCFGAHEKGCSAGAARGRAGDGGKRRNGRRPKTPSRHGYAS